MNAQELMALQQSSEAPFNHREYTIWLHNQIVKNIAYDILNLAHSEKERDMANQIINLQSLKLITK